MSALETLAESLEAVSRPMAALTGTLPGADVRGFYQALGVELPGWVQLEASVRCFADPAAHANEDRDPSCSVNVETGVWHCWGCGAAGGAYDAALAVGLRPRSAIDMMIHHGLVERRAVSASQTRRPTVEDPPRHAAHATRPLSSVHCRCGRETSRRGNSSSWRCRGRRGCFAPSTSVCGLGASCSSSAAVGRRVTFPIRDGCGALQGVLRYAPRHDRAPKMLAVPGTRLGPLPHPAAETSGRLLLVEGPPDMISARSQGLAAIAVPGDDAWNREWAHLFIGRIVTVAMDCDAAGRTAAIRIASDLKDAGVTVTDVDLAPEREDIYDLTDWFVARHGAADALAQSSPGLARTGLQAWSRGASVERLKWPSHSG